MFGRRYSRSCFQCRKEYVFKSIKEIKAFDMGSNHKCPVCGKELSCTPLCPSLLPPPPCPCDNLVLIELENGIGRQIEQVYEATKDRTPNWGDVAEWMADVTTRQLIDAFGPDVQNFYGYHIDLSVTPQVKCDTLEITISVE